MVSLRWTYKLSSQVEETANKAKSLGFTTVWLYGESRTYHEEYPLNQVKIIGGTLSPNIRVHVSPHSTQIYYYIENFPGIEGVERLLAEKEDAERTLNCIVMFAPNETARFEPKTAKPVKSPSMLNLVIRTEEDYHATLDKIEQIIFGEINRAFADVSHGRMHFAIRRLDCLSNELVSFQTELIRMAKDWGRPEAERWEEDLKKMLGSPHGFFEI